MSDSYWEYLCYYCLYVMCGGLFVLYVFMYKRARPKYYGLLYFCLAFAAIAFGVQTAALEAHASFQALANLTMPQEAIRTRLLWHTAFVGFVVPGLATALAGESLNRFMNTKGTWGRGT